jgi:site-specific DNA recombinase
MKNKKDDEKKKVAIYCRVSTYEQGQGNFSSLQGQEDLLKEYCKNKGWQVYSVYIDKASGSSLERDEIKKLLADAEEKNFDIVAATKIDRVSRSVLDYLDIDKRFTDLGIDIVFATQSIDTTTPAGKMQRNIMLAFAEFERDMIAERTREKLFYQAQKGFWGGGHALLGFDVINKLLVINTPESETVKKIFDYYMEEPSLNKVANRLNKEGFRTKIRKTKKGVQSGGGEFNKDSVNRILRNKIYIGKIQYKNEEFAGLHQPIIDKNLFEKIQLRLEESKKDKFITYNQSELLLLGAIKCGFCGNSMTTSFAKTKDGNKYFYYKCTNKTKFSGSKCESKDISAHEIENFISKLIKNIAASEPIFNAVFEQMNLNEGKEKSELEKQKKTLEKNLHEGQKEIDNLLNFITQAGVENFELTSNKLKNLKGQRDLIEEEINKIATQLNLIKSIKIDKKELKTIFSQIPAIYEDASTEMRRQLIKVIIQEIKISLGKKKEKGDIEIHFRGDGRIKKEWVNKIANPDKLVSSYYRSWLREQDSNLQPFG